MIHMVIPIFINVASITSEVITIILTEVFFDELLILVPQCESKRRRCREFDADLTHLPHLAFVTIMVQNFYIETRYRLCS